MTELEEIFDVVDAQDQVVTSMTRSEVHAQNLLHRSVHVLVMDENHRVFLQLRSLDRDCDPDLWDSSVGGHLHSGERYDHAVIRETEEELGIQLQATPPRLFKLEASPETAYEFCWVYQIYDNGPFKLDPSEAADGRWFTKEELNDWMSRVPEKLTSSFRLIWQQYCKLESTNE